MKKVLNFFTNTDNGKKTLLTIRVGTIISLIVGLILCLPILWLGGEKYEITWMNSIAPYFFYPFIVLLCLVIFLFIPYLLFVGTSEKYDGNKRLFFKGIAIFFSIIPGALFYSFIADALSIPSVILNIAGALICGMLYLWIMNTILKKPFSVTQEFIPLN